MEAILSFDTDHDDYESVVATVRSAYGLPLQPTEPDTEPADNGDAVEPTDGPWNVRRATRYLQQLAPAARNTVTVVTVYGTIDRAQTATLVGTNLRGHLSSLGYAAKNTRGLPNGARPFYRQRDDYVMSDPARRVFVAAFLRAGNNLAGQLRGEADAAGPRGEHVRRLIAEHDSTQVAA